MSSNSRRGPWQSLDLAWEDTPLYGEPELAEEAKRLLWHMTRRAIESYGGDAAYVLYRAMSGELDLVRQLTGTDGEPEERQWTACQTILTSLGLRVLAGQVRAELDRQAEQRRTTSPTREEQP
jgi:hypothetical protein